MAGDSTLSGLPAISAVTGTTLFYGVQAGDYQVTADQLVTYIGRIKLTTNTTIYVRTDGNDSNSGWLNTAGGAKLTIAGAFALAATLDLNGYTLTVQVADGTYSSGVILVPKLVGQAGVTNFQLLGNLVTPTNVVLSGTVSADWFFSAQAGAAIYVNGFKFQSSSANGASSTIDARYGGVIYYENIDSGAAPNSQINAWGGGVCWQLNSCTISAGAKSRFAAGAGGLIMSFDGTTTLSGTPAFSTAFVATSLCGIVQSIAAFSGSATGSRYNAVSNSVIETYGSGTTYFPGNSAGTTSTGGLYE